MAKQLSTDLLVKKFKTVSNSQDSIPMLSLWIIHHKSHHRKIVEAWLDTVKKSKTPHRLTLLYLCNDVVQNCNRKNSSIYRESFADVLIEAVSHLRDSTIKIDVQRVVRIWAKRGIFDAEFTDQLLAALITNRAPEKLRNKLLIEYKTSTLIDEIKTFKAARQGIEFEQNRLKAIRMDVSSSDAVRKLKDKIGGEKFSNEFEESASQLELFLEHYEKYVGQRKNLLDVLDQGTVYYHAQYHEAKIVVNAYKNFEGRVIRMKQGLDKVKQRFPLRSDGSLPLSVSNQDDDMEMSDEDKELGNKPSKIVAMETKHRRSVTKTSTTSTGNSNAAESVLKLLASGLSSMKNEDASDSLKRIITGLASRPGVRRASSNLAPDTPTSVESTKGTSQTFRTGLERIAEDNRSAAPIKDQYPGEESPPSPTGSSDLNIASPSRHQSLDSRLAEFLDSRLTRDRGKFLRHDSDNDSDPDLSKVTTKLVNKKPADGVVGLKSVSESEPNILRPLDYFNMSNPSVVSSIAAKENPKVKSDGGFKSTIHQPNQFVSGADSSGPLKAPISDGSSTPTLDEVSYATTSSRSTFLSPPHFSGDAFGFLTKFVGSATKPDSIRDLDSRPSPGIAATPREVQSSTNQGFDHGHLGRGYKSASPGKREWNETSSNIVVPVWPIDASPSDTHSPTSPPRSQTTETNHIPPWQSYSRGSEMTSPPSNYVSSSTWLSGAQQQGNVNLSTSPLCQQSSTNELQGAYSRSGIASENGYFDPEMRSTFSQSDTRGLVTKQRNWELDESCDIDYRANSSGLTPDQGLSISSSSAGDEQPGKLPMGSIPSTEHPRSIYENNLRSNTDVFHPRTVTPPLLPDSRNRGDRNEEQRQFFSDTYIPPRMSPHPMRPEFPHDAGPTHLNPPIRPSPENDISRPIPPHPTGPAFPHDTSLKRPSLADDLSRPFLSHSMRSDFSHDTGIILRSPPVRPSPENDISRPVPSHPMAPNFPHDTGPIRPPPPTDDLSRPFSPHSMRSEFLHDAGSIHHKPPIRPSPENDISRPIPPNLMRPEFPCPIRHELPIPPSPENAISRLIPLNRMRPEFPHGVGPTRYEPPNRPSPENAISRPIPPHRMRPEFPHDARPTRYEPPNRPSPENAISCPIPPHRMRPEFPHDAGPTRYEPPNRSSPENAISRPIPPHRMRPEFPHDVGPTRYEPPNRPSPENAISRPIPPHSMRPEFPHDARPNRHEPPSRAPFSFSNERVESNARFHSPMVPNEFQRFKEDNDRGRFPVRPTSPYPPRFAHPSSPRERFPRRPISPHNDIPRPISPPHSFHRPRRPISPRMRCPGRPFSPRERFAPPDMHRPTPRNAGPMRQPSADDDLIELELALLTDERRREEEALHEAGLMHVSRFPPPRPSNHRFLRPTNFRPQMIRPPRYNGMPRMRY